jgi:hypothetical protein
MVGVHLQRLQTVWRCSCRSALRSYAATVLCEDGLLGEDEVTADIMDRGDDRLAGKQNHRDRPGAWYIMSGS